MQSFPESTCGRKRPRAGKVRSFPCGRPRGDHPAADRGAEAGGPRVRSPRGPDQAIPCRLQAGWNPSLRRTGLSRGLHSHRKTFGTELARAGVSLATSQKLMRHSDPKLTSNIYTDLKNLDLLTAVSSMPSVVAKVVVVLAARHCNQCQRTSHQLQDETQEKGSVITPCGATKNPGFPGVYRIAGDLGFEPRLTDPESVVLPLHQSPKSLGAELPPVFGILRIFELSFKMGWEDARRESASRCLFNSGLRVHN